MTKARKKTTKSETKKRQTNPVKKRELTDEEKARLEAYRLREGQTKPVKFKADADSPHPGGITAADPGDPLICTKLAETLGTPDSDAQGLLFDQVVQSFAGVPVANHIEPSGFNGKKVISAANQAAALLAGIGPRDELEGLLACQMIACHNAAMYTAKMAILTGQTFEGKRANMNYAAKLMALFTAQMEALRKHRTGGQQKVVVEHVNVNQGGQAVVGQVNVGGGGNRQTEERPHAT
jgi:hypothetical protein